MGCVCSSDAEEQAERIESERAKFYIDAERMQLSLKNNKAAVALDKLGELRAVNNYKVTEKLAKGSFGDVYLAEDKCALLGTEHLRYALKAVSRKEKKFQRELQILCRIDHPNVVRMLEYVDDPTQACVYIVFEAGLGGVLCECATDGSLKGKPWPEGKARKYFTQLVEGVEYIHAMSIVHRDIKPENIIYTTKKQDTVQLIDFGESRILKTCDDSSSQTVGTPLYHSPESTDGTGSLFSEKAKDIWALGVILYLVTMGTVPFGGGATNTISLWAKISEDPLVFPEGYTSQPIVNLLTRMLTKDPTLRATPAEIKDHPWITGQHIAPRIHQAVTLTSIEDFTSPESYSSIGSPGTLTHQHSFSSSFGSVTDMHQGQIIHAMPPGEIIEEVSVVAPVVLSERELNKKPSLRPSPSSTINVSKLPLSERRTFKPPSLESTVEALTSTTSSNIPSPVSSRFSGTRNVSFNSPPASLSRTGSKSSRTNLELSLEVTSKKSERLASLKLPKTPKLTKAVSIPALELSCKGGSEPDKDGRIPSPTSSIESCERTPMSEILNIVSQGARSKVKILIVDPVYHNREIIGKMLREMIKPQIGVSFEIDTAEDGDEAVRAVLDVNEADPYSAVIMEIHMPRVTGVSATTQIRIQEQMEGRLEIPIFGMAADVTSDLENLCRDAGMQCLFRKPLSAANLAQMLLWLNIVCKKTLDSSLVFTPRHGWHESYKRNMSNKIDHPAKMNWWYTVEFDSNDVSTPDEAKIDSKKHRAHKVEKTIVL